MSDLCHIGFKNPIDKFDVKLLLEVLASYLHLFCMIYSIYLS